MTYDELRITYQSDEQMARAMFDRVWLLEIELSTTRSNLSVSEALRALAEAQRDKLKNKPAHPAPRRIYRGEN